MTCLAAGGFAVRTKACHLQAELAVMRICVATGASAVVEPVRNCLAASEFRRVVAIGTDHGHVRAF